MTYIQPSVGCKTRLRFIHDLGVYCDTSNTTQVSVFQIDAKYPKYGKKYGCMIPSLMATSCSFGEVSRSDEDARITLGGKPTCRLS